MNKPTHHDVAETRWQFWARWSVTLAWALVIFNFSTESFTSVSTAAILREILNFIHLRLSPGEFGSLNILLRKMGHLTEYMILSLCLYYCFLNSTRTQWRTRFAAWSIFVAGMYSLTDEFHQSFVPGRTPSLMDCGIDTMGAALGMLGIFLCVRLFLANGSSTAVEVPIPSISE